MELENIITLVGCVLTIGGASFHIGRKVQKVVDSLNELGARLVSLEGSQIDQNRRLEEQANIIAELRGGVA